jgi:hypothetical protein
MQTFTITLPVSLHEVLTASTCFTCTSKSQVYIHRIYKQAPAIFCHISRTSAHQSAEKKINIICIGTGIIYMEAVIINRQF